MTLKDCIEESLRRSGIDETEIRKRSDRALLEVSVPTYAALNKQVPEDKAGPLIDRLIDLYVAAQRLTPQQLSAVNAAALKRARDLAKRQ